MLRPWEYFGGMMMRCWYSPLYWAGPLCGWADEGNHEMHVFRHCAELAFSPTHQSTPVDAVILGRRGKRDHWCGRVQPQVRNFGVHCVLTRNDSQLIEAAAFGCLGMVGDMVGVAYWQISYGHQGHHGKVGLTFQPHEQVRKVVTVSDKK